VPAGFIENLSAALLVFGHLCQQGAHSVHKRPRGGQYGDRPSPYIITPASTVGFTEGPNGLCPNPRLSKFSHVLDSPGIGQNHMQPIAGHPLLSVADKTHDVPQYSSIAVDFKRNSDWG